MGRVYNNNNNNNKNYNNYEIVYLVGTTHLDHTVTIQNERFGE